MKKSVSLRTQLFWLMALLVFLQSAALVFSLLVSRVFFMLDAEAFRLFDSTASARTQAYNASVGRLIGNMADETRSLGARLQSIAATGGVEPNGLYLDDLLYFEAADAGTDAVVSLLRNNIISGAFFMLNGSNTEKQSSAAHSAVYVRNSAPDSATGETRNYLLEVGPITVSQRHQIPVSINWKLDVRFDREGYSPAYYENPVSAALQYTNVEMERYGYWTPPMDVLGDHQRVITYTMPLLDSAGVPFGVLGVEISLPLLTLSYLPNTDLPYQSSFYAIASVQDSALDLSWYIPSGPLAQVYLSQGQALPIAPVAGTELYETEVDGLGDMYCAVQPLVVYSRNSPFYGENWTLLGFVPKQVLHETSLGVRDVLIISIIITTVISFAAILLLVFATTRKISGLSKYVRSLSPHGDIHFTHTGMREIDELTAAVEMLNKSVMKASKTTSKILELTLMPLGGFEVSSENASVVLTEYVYTLLGITPGVQVSKAEWARVYAALMANPAPNYENIYQFLAPDGNVRWLRILEAPTETGNVGIILDVSKDIEEHRRLAHELDYDALTHLYSRTAFKREAHLMIMTKPEKMGAMIFVDLDNLKYMNDTFGHDMGDRLIIRAGEMFRQFELHGGIISRISGDEFAIYLHGYESKDEVRELVHKDFAQNEDYLLRIPDGSTQRIRFSSGIAYYPMDSDNVTDLLKLSDYAMYEAKHNQKGTLFEFNRESYQENIYLLDNREAINRLLDEGLIRFAFQPIISLETGEIFAYEALMRPLLNNFKSPLEILSVAAAQSKLGQLERLVMMHAMQAVSEHLPALGDACVFINSIPSQTLSGEDHLFLERQYAGIFERIVMEITEAENNSPSQLETKLAFIRRNGIRIAIDDFGSGYSNEVRILAMNPNIVKVDIALISGIDTDADKQKLISNLVSFCHPKGVKLVAEGVERREELAEVIRLGMDYVQGYYTARPAFDFLPLRAEVRDEIRRLRAELG